MIRIIELDNGLPVIFPAALLTDPATGLNYLREDFLHALVAHVARHAEPAPEPEPEPEPDADWTPPEGPYPFEFLSGNRIRFRGETGEDCTFKATPQIWNIARFVTASGYEDGEPEEDLIQRIWEGYADDGQINDALYKKGNPAFARAGFPWKFRRRSGNVALVPVQRDDS